MTISYPAGLPLPAPISTTGSMSVVAASVTSVTIVPASDRRLNGGMIVNKANKSLWILYEATTATTSSPCLEIPGGGGSVDIPQHFIGQISGIWEAGATGEAVVLQFLTPSPTVIVAN